MARAQTVLDYIQNKFRENPIIEVKDRVYQVGDEPIAKGGMGLVYAVTVSQNTAFPFQVYDRKKRLYEVQEPLTQAVLKIPFADQEFARAAIRTEREALERPAHPNVVRLLEVIPIDAGNGETTDGLILERLLPSPPELLAKGPLENRKGCDAASSVEMVANLLKALNTIHYHKRIYLCDIKPLNIMLRVGFDVRDKNINSRQEYVRRLSNGELQWAFIDLGIAVPRAAVNTKTKSFIGSTEYSPPEAVLEFFLSEKRDVYSLVATFAEMLTGKKPYLAALLEAKRAYKTMIDEAVTAEEKQKVMASRGRLAFQAVREYMQDGKPAFDLDDLLEGFLRSPECSNSSDQELEGMTQALRMFFTEGLHPDPRERATADRLFQILRDPFGLNARATDSFLDDFFKLRFRQGVLPFASEIVSAEDESAAYHYQSLPISKFDGYFDLPSDTQAWSGSGQDTLASQDFGNETLGPLFNTYVDSPLPKAGKKEGRRGLSQNYGHIPEMVGAFDSNPVQSQPIDDDEDDFAAGLVSMAPSMPDRPAPPPQPMPPRPTRPRPTQPRPTRNQPPPTMRRPKRGPGSAPIGRQGVPVNPARPGARPPQTGKFRRPTSEQNFRAPAANRGPASAPRGKPMPPPPGPGSRRTGRMGPPPGPSNPRRPTPGPQPNPQDRPPRGPGQAPGPGPRRRGTPPPTTQRMQRPPQPQRGQSGRLPRPGPPRPPA